MGNYTIEWVSIALFLKRLHTVSRSIDADNALCRSLFFAVEKAESDEGHFHEDDAACLIRDILDAIRYIHDEKHIVHRDLKVRARE